MTRPIGFGRREREKPEKPFDVKREARTVGGPSMVLVQFPGCGIPLSYYNGRFDIKPGDIVFVDGKYEGRPGRVEKVSTRFNVDPEAYKHILGVADTGVKGRFYPAMGYFLTFDADALPYRKALSWYKPVPDQEYFIEYDEPGFSLDDPGRWKVSSGIMERGIDYHNLNKVAYLSLSGGVGRAIVTGTKPYEVRFQYRESMITNLSCNCPCGYLCKHDVAVLLELKEALELIKKSFAGDFKRAGYFAMVTAEALFSFALQADPKAELLISS